MSDRGTQIAVRRATTADVPALSQSLHRAFWDDPIAVWMSPDERRRERRGAFGFRTWLEKLYLQKGEIYTDEGRTGAAVWAPPGKWRISPASQLRLSPRFLRIFGVSRAPTILRGLAVLDRKHPDDRPHWYLGILGTHPDHQGKGIGSALMQPVLERCDAEGLPAYLESSKERNVPFYARHGFEVTEEVRLPEGPPLWLMWREPRG